MKENGDFEKIYLYAYQNYNLKYTCFIAQAHHIIISVNTDVINSHVPRTKHILFIVDDICPSIDFKLANLRVQSFSESPDHKTQRRDKSGQGNMCCYDMDIHH